MTRVFIHVEASLQTQQKPYRLSACTLDRRFTFEANIVWPDTPVFSDELSRALVFGSSMGTTDGNIVTYHGSGVGAQNLFSLWLENVGQCEMWTESWQRSWRLFSALGMSGMPIFDLSTLVMVGGLDWMEEISSAGMEAVGKVGAASPRLGCYKQSILFETVRRKTNLLK